MISTSVISSGWHTMWEWIGYEYGDLPFSHEMLAIVAEVYPGGIKQFDSDYDESR